MNKGSMMTGSRVWGAKYQGLRVPGFRVPQFRVLKSSDFGSRAWKARDQGSGVPGSRILGFSEKKILRSRFLGARDQWSQVPGSMVLWARDQWSRILFARTKDPGFPGYSQTWNFSQVPQACLCKILLARVKCLAKHTLLLLQFGLVCLQILAVELTRVSLHYTLKKFNHFTCCTRIILTGTFYWS